jgi:hypothetical protein
MFWRRRRERELADARAEAQRWYERLGGQITALSGEAQAVKQALADAGERYTAAGAQLERASTPRQYELARETALEGLYYVRAARTAMGIDPGPELPAVPSQRGVPQITQDRELDVQGHRYRASPDPGDSTPYYYPGGRVQGRPVPAGWYSEPWWRSAISTGAGVFGGLLLFDVLSGGFYDAAGYDQGFAQGYDQGVDQVDTGDAGGSDFGDTGGGDFGGF